jgi:hypothetical protein
MRIPALGFCCLAVAELILRGQIGGLETPAWQDVRKLQPEGLQLKMTLPKDHFYQGEIIDATLEFSNTSQAPYHLWVGNYDRSGRITDIAFHAQDATGQQAPDPLAWYFMMGGVGGGLGNFKDLGNWTIALPVNQWLRFDKPGIYTLYAWSNRVQKGGYEQGKQHTEAVSLVSDKVEITIETLSPEKEKKIIAAAQELIIMGGELGPPAVAQLRYLETPAARAQLVPLLASPSTSFDAALGLCAAPDPSAEAGNILAAVSQGKLPLRVDITDLYSRLKTHDLIATFSPAKVTPQDAQQLGQKLGAAMAQARDEITAAALKSSGGKGDAYIQVLLTKFQQNNRDPAIRADLVRHQLELSIEQANGLLEGWDYLGGEELLPLARKMAGGPTYNLAALMALVKIKPNEAQALLVSDAQRPKSNIFTNRRGSFQFDRLHLTPTPLPELDSVLREKLASGKDLEATLFYIDEFGTPALLPDVIACYQLHEGKWACELQKFSLRYWLRCDPKGGTEALSRALQARASTGCYKGVLEDVLSDRWNVAALPLLTQALDDPENEVVLSAIKVLELHADSTYIDKSIAAVERINAATMKGSPTPGTVMRGQASFVARQLLESKNWHYSPEQQQRLQAIAKGQ